MMVKLEFLDNRGTENKEKQIIFVRLVACLLFFPTSPFKNNQHIATVRAVAEALCLCFGSNMLTYR